MHPIVRPGHRGPEVALLHQQLLERGLQVPTHERITEFFGPGTVGSVHDFQVKSGLDADDTVGPKTWRALDEKTEAEKLRPPIMTAGLPPLAAKTLRIADAEYRASVVEVPPGSNRGPRVDEYLIGHEKDGFWLLELGGKGIGASWCGRFAKWCVDEAARQLGWASPISGWGDLASAAKWLARGNQAGLVSKIPTAGSIGCILTGGHGHVVIVVDGLGSGRLLTIEGNSGNRVTSRERRSEEFIGFVRMPS